MTEHIVMPATRRRRIAQAHRNYVDLIDRGVFNHDRARAVKKLKTATIAAAAEATIETITQFLRR